MTIRPITEDDLQAYVDGVLDDERHRNVSEYLLANPEAAERVSSYRSQAAALRSALDTVAREPVPSRLNLTTIAAAQAPGRRTGSLRIAAAAVVLLAIGGTGGWIMKSYALPPTEGVAALAREALATYGTFAPDRLRPVEVRADGGDAFREFADATVGRPVTIPDLSTAGYRLMGGRVVPTAHGPGLMLMYDNDKGSRLVMLTRPMAVDQDKPMVATDTADVRGWSWAKNGLGYSLVGALPHTDLHSIANMARSQV